MTRERAAACDPHAVQRVEFVDRYQNFRPTDCPWCRIALLEASLHDLLNDYDKPDYEQDGVIEDRARKLLRQQPGPGEPGYIHPECHCVSCDANRSQAAKPGVET